MGKIELKIPWDTNSEFEPVFVFLKICLMMYADVDNSSSGYIIMVFTIPFYGLELLIGLIQALIFSGLTLVFGTVAISSAHEEAEQKHH